MPLIVVLVLVVLGITATFVTFVIERHRSGGHLEASMRDFAATQAAFSHIARVADLAA